MFHSMEVFIRYSLFLIFLHKLLVIFLASDEAYKNIWESNSGKNSRGRQYNFKEFEKKLLGCGDSG